MQAQMSGGSMTGAAKRMARVLGVDPGTAYQSLSARSIDAALAEQKLTPLCNQLRRVVPDISGQYTRSFDAAAFDRYWERKTRGMHAFQVRCVLDALDHIGGENLVLVDIGDSSGNHARYIRSLAPPGRVGRIVGVNLDPVAVDKIRESGGEAVLCAAEDVDAADLNPDLFISFETLEHLTDPVRFLHRLAIGSSARYLLFTVPYRRRSRFGGALLRRPEDRMPDRMTPEEVHILELCPADWELVARLGGYRKVFARTYLQYPKRRPMRLTAPLWRRYDFEGFLALFVERDLSLASRYTGW